MSIPVSGSVSKAVENPEALVGNIEVLFDGVQSATIPVGADGTFSLSEVIPLNTGFGNHTVQIVYSPDDPRVDASKTTVSVYVVNSPTILAVALFFGITPGIIAVSRRKQRAHRAQREASERHLAALKAEYPLARPPDWDRVLEMVEAEPTPRGRIATSFRLARTLINNSFGRRTKESETHREFYSNATVAKPILQDYLKPLVDLFEVAEYSPFIIQRSQGEQAEQILIALHKAKQI
jgi:hypothetical protein